MRVHHPTRWLGALVAVTIGLAGCGGASSLSYPTPPATSPVPVPTVPPVVDLSRASLAAVPGRSTTVAVEIGPGKATINGTVLGPSGPVSGATVQADRIVGDATASTQATTGADGSFTIAGVLGGRYRVRAWQAPSLALTDPQIFFLGGTAAKSLTLMVKSYSGIDVASALAPAVPIAGAPANLEILVTNPIVGSDGAVRHQPLAGASIQLVDGPNWVVVADVLTTSASGTAEFSVSCQAPGAAALSASVNAAAPNQLQLSDCAPVPTTTTTTTPTTLPNGNFPTTPITQFPPISGPPVT